VAQRRIAPALFVVLLAIFALILLPQFASLLVDWWWFRELGFEVLFTRRIGTRLALFTVVALAAGGLVHLNLAIATRGGVTDVVRILSRTGVDAANFDLAGLLRRLARPIAILVGLLVGTGANALWDTMLRAAYQVPFGVADPVFDRDVSYYVFTLPAFAAVLGVLTSLTVLTLFLLLAVYFLRGEIEVNPRRLRIESSAGMHLAIVLATLFVLWALQLWFVDAATLLFSTTGPLVGASYTDLHASLPALRVSAIAALLAAAAVIEGGIRGRLGFNAVLALAGYFAIGLVGRGLTPGVMQKFVVAPTELTRESPYLERHIAATRRAWGIDSVEVRDLVGEADLTLASIRANAPTIDNVRLWDREPLLRTFGQLQEIRTYYDFISVDDDRYWIDGRYRQVLLAPRELNTASLPTRTFINEHLTFTHGMGLTLSPVNQVTPEGLPVLFVKDLPPSAVGSIKVTRPQIYYGELTDPFAVVKTKQQEFDFPAGDENVYRTYDGNGGVVVGGVFKRLVLALNFRSMKLLLSGDIGADSRILYHRNILTRVKRAFPFLRLDRDPYLVVAENGTLQWIQDAYTTTNRYPYSYRSADGTSYIRNSVKLVIDAYHGTVTPYVSDPNDPLIQTWQKVYPGVFQPIAKMPADLRAHIRYPDELFRAQTARYVTYHMNTPATFYNREDEWQVPVVNRQDEKVPFMRHIVMRLPDEKAEEFIYMAPFTPRGKDNLAAWMVARNDGAQYGKLRVYRFPRQTLVFGPRQIENRINQDTEISRQVSLWDQRGSRVIRGDLLVIPIEEALLYVQPVYLQAEGGTIPELKRVVVAFQNQVVMRETLEAALSDMFGGAVGSRASADLAAAARLTAGAADAAAPALDAATRADIAEAQRRYQAALEAQRAGDWARYGEEIRQLGAVLERLNLKRPR
jgi:uncharacterized membrane protein (UPF0182 family)